MSIDTNDSTSNDQNNMEIDVDASAHAEDHTDNIMDVVTHPTSLGEGLPTQISPSNRDVVNSGNGNDGDSPMDACERKESACGVNDMSLGTKEIDVKSKDKSETIPDNGKEPLSLPKIKSQRKCKLP